MKAIFDDVAADTEKRAYTQYATKIDVIFCVYASFFFSSSPHSGIIFVSLQPNEHTFLL